MIGTFGCHGYESKVQFGVVYNEGEKGFCEESCRLIVINSLHMLSYECVYLLIILIDCEHGVGMCVLLVGNCNKILQA